LIEKARSRLPSKEVARLPKLIRIGFVLWLNYSLLSLGGEWSENLVLLLVGLETTVANLGGGIDELDVDVLGLPGLGGREDGLTEGDWSLASSSNTTLDKEEVLVDLTVVGEATHWGNVLGNGISFGSGVVVHTVDGTSTNTVDLLVHLGTGVVSELTTASNSPLDCSWMPGTNTGDLSETSMSLTVQSGDTESLDHTACSLTAGNTNGINALGMLKDLTDLDFLLELGLSPIDLLGNGATVNLDLHDVSLVLTEGELADLGGANDTDDGSVLLDTLSIAREVSLGRLVLILAVNILGEGLLLGVHPVLVESALNVGVHVLGPSCSKGAETTGSLNVTNHTDDLHGWALNDGGGVDNILLDGLLTLTTLLILDNVGHTGLIAHKGSKVDGLGGVIPGE